MRGLLPVFMHTKIKFYLQFVPDWFVNEKQIEIWDDEDDYHDDDENTFFL